MLITPPTIEPLTLEEGKLCAALDWEPGDPRDKQMRGWIAAARGQVETDTGVALLTQTHRLELGNLGTGVVVLPRRPVQSFTVKDADGEELDEGDFILRTAGVNPVATTLETLTSWPEDGSIEFVAGFDSADALLAHAPGLVHAVELLTAHYATTGRDLTIVGVSIARTLYGYDEALAGYQLVVVP